MKPETEELKEKIELFFDKKDVSTTDRYFITKSLQEDYWDEIASDGPTEPEEEPEDEFEDEFDEDNDDIELPEEKEEKDHKKGIKNLLKKPLIKVK